jgi:hypothetical protein
MAHTKEEKPKKWLLPLEVLIDHKIPHIPLRSCLVNNLKWLQLHHRSCSTKLKQPQPLPFQPLPQPYRNSSNFRDGQKLHL